MTVCLAPSPSSPKRSNPEQDLVTTHLWVASKVARKYASRTMMEYDDLYQEAVIGLIRAAKMYDLNKAKGKFASWAYSHAAWACGKAVKKSYLVQIPQKIWNNVVKPAFEFRSQGLDDEDICARLQISKHTLYKAIDAHSSLDWVDSETSTSPLECLPHLDNTLCMDCQPEIIKSMLMELEDKEIDHLINMMLRGKTGAPGIKSVDAINLLIKVSSLINKHGIKPDNCIT